MGAPVVASRRVRAQLEAVREYGAVNMLDRTGVQRIANDHNFYDLVVFCEDKHAYSGAIFYGIEVPDDDPDDGYEAVIAGSGDEDVDDDEDDAWCAWCRGRIADTDGVMWGTHGEYHEDCWQQYLDDQNSTSHW